MKSMQFIGCWLLFFCTIACANNDSAREEKQAKTLITSGVATNDTFESGRVISPVMCKADATQSYALYIPLKGNRQSLPVIYFFDPHGNGSLPLNKYKGLADIYNFILVGSNNSKNGNDWSVTENIWNNLFNDSQKRLRIDSKLIFACGFSGGARVASSIALNHKEVKGVIANSAGLPGMTNASNVQFSFTGIAGEGDMNMTEVIATGAALDKTAMRHRVILFDGKHEWAPASTMDIAFAAFEFDAMHDKRVDRDDWFINMYVNAGKKRIEGYLKTKDYIKGQQECALDSRMLDGLTDHVKWFQEKDRLIKSYPAFQQQWQSRQSMLITEQSIHELYERNFEAGDNSYWSKAIAELQTKSKSANAEASMYQRLIAYLSLAFYSISSQLIAGHRDKEAQHFVGLYKMVDETNSEAWYLSALLKARNQDAKGTQADLLKAAAKGFTDTLRMLQQPEFQALKTRVDLRLIKSKMK